MPDLAFLTRTPQKCALHRFELITDCETIRNARSAAQKASFEWSDTALICSPLWP